MTHEELLALVQKERDELNKFVETINQEIAYRKGRLAILQELLQAEEGTDGNEPATV